MTSWAEQLAGCSTPAAFDVLRAHALPILESPRRGLDVKMKIAGPVLTVLGAPNPDISAHDSLNPFIREVLWGAPPGHVVVCQPQDRDDLAVEALWRRGAYGYYIDEGSRDADEICEIQFPVFCHYRSPIEIVGSWRLESTGRPIEICGVSISVTTSSAIATTRCSFQRNWSVITKTVETMQTDSTMRTAIPARRDPYDANLEFAKL